MSGGSDRERSLARQGRLVAAVIAVTAVLWLAAQWLGGKLGLPPRYAFLFDFAALAAFLWALIVGWRLWRQSRDDK
ncbi:hypothetical protein SAMN05216257_10679 [Meinhardsimonia xiamenensis]|jgi:hypothetical protein|uniref:DUF5337 domain-containing protein n=1 Tax=Meinhardsimonia xiamenensis TaxID=990712 RepID=A0A1G9G387_9RHOB|nr:DUF5337 family protein [Meinhardsimonia xiamenensis]PRX32698.1 hypothetical protein LV81_02459 [Meinhardsimonia xiamenensis]SDK95138.1 hypothetical protein SAMN05216257_10679 [Meinhardsimonia xiamenensis]